MSHPNHCGHDCSDFDDPTTDDAGCCTPMPVRRDCEAPALPVPECDEELPEVAFDEESQTFVVTTTMYDSTCSPLQDSDGSNLLSLIA